MSDRKEAWLGVRGQGVCCTSERFEVQLEGRFTTWSVDQAREFLWQAISVLSQSPPAADRSKALKFCSFCSKHETAELRIIVGPRDICICQECCALCHDIFESEPDDVPEATARVIPHGALEVHAHNGNTLCGIATPELGTTSFEVWRSSVAVGSSTPMHCHASEEVFVFLRGKGKARIGDDEVAFEAPATVVAPAHVPHQFFNVGEEPTDAIVVIGANSTIWDEDGKEMRLPWRSAEGVQGVVEWKNLDQGAS